jgi:curli production assembly/transport component CsgE
VPWPRLDKDPLPGTKLDSKANDGNGNGVKRVFEDPLKGVIINRTVTVQGREFYQYFAHQWAEKDPNGQFTVTVYERPSARFGSEIWVQFRDKQMFRTFLPPARSATKKISAIAVDVVFKNITDSEVERIMTRTPDLGPEEM